MTLNDPLPSGCDRLRIGYVAQAQPPRRVAPRKHAPDPGRLPVSHLANRRLVLAFPARGVAAAVADLVRRDALVSVLPAFGADEVLEIVPKQQ